MVTPHDAQHGSLHPPPSAAGRSSACVKAARRLPLLAALPLALLIPASASADTYNVSNTSDVAAQNPTVGCATPSGSSAHGACTLRSAVQAANDNAGSTIKLAAGTYKLTIAPSGGDDDSTGDLNLTNGSGTTTIKGAGSGTSGTIVDANFIDRAFHVDDDVTAEIDGVRIRNGRPGGLGNVNSCPSQLPSADAPGGGILSHGDLTLNNDVITSDMALGFGGGIASDSSGAVTMGSTDVTNNRACQSSESSFVFGGGLAQNGFGDVNVDLSTFSGNSAESRNTSGGGGIGVRSSDTVNVNRSAITSNQAGDGGGVLGESSGGKTTLALHLFADLLTQNTAGGQPASSPVRGGLNTRGFGAGVDFEDGFNSVVNTTVHNNNGDGIAVSSGDTRVSYSTVTQNDSNIRDGESNITLDDTIVAQPGPHGNCEGFAGFTASDHNLFDDAGTNCNAGPSDLPNKNPKLGPLQDNGGPTQTRALLLGSPAVDAADGGNCSQLAKNVDQRGVTRPQGPRCDIGAFEQQRADLALTASAAKDTIDVGEKDTVTDTVTNNGPSDATNVTFTDPAPAGFTIKSVEPSQGTCTHTKTTVKCNLGKLAKGKKATIVIVLKAKSSGKITLKSSVKGHEPDPKPGNNGATVTIKVVQPASGCGPSKFHFIYDTEDATQDDLVYLARVYLDGKHIASHRRHSIHSVTIIPPAKGTHEVVVVGFLTDGRRIILSRTYHGCSHGDTSEHFEERGDPGGTGAASFGIAR